MFPQLDSFKVPKKLIDKSGKITDETRALFLLCEARGILQSYYRATRSFSRFTREQVCDDALPIRSPPRRVADAALFRTYLLT